MKLIIFDIDGTIVNSVKADDECFKETFETLYRIDLSQTEWSEFKNVTDSGMTLEIFEKYLNRKPTNGEIVRIKKHFYELLVNRTKEFSEIDGALKFIDRINKNPNFISAFATGGWKETALLKVNSIKLNINQSIIKTADDHFNRAKIIELAITESLSKVKIIEFESITYIGDGIWDFETTNELGIDFIGIDSKNNCKLKMAGVEKIVSNYLETDKIVNWLIEKTTGNV